MRKDQYFKHDASASGNPKLMNLLQKEGPKGYGVYWLLLEMLRKTADFRLSMTYLGSLAAVCRTHRQVVERIVREYDLFVVEENYFFSPGMNKRMRNFIAKISEKSPNIPPDSEDNLPKISKEALLSARKEEQRREEQRNNSSNSVVADLESPIQSWASLVDEMEADRSWMDMVGMHSGLGQLFIDHRHEVVELFREHIRLYDKGSGLIHTRDVRQYFANYMAAGSRTSQGVREKLLAAIRKRQAENTISPYETMVEGRRMYLGRTIPEDAPPRPDEFSVWDEGARRWTR